MNSMNDNSGAEEQTSLEHSMCEEVEHTSEVTKTTVNLMRELH